MRRFLVTMGLLLGTLELSGAEKVDQLIHDLGSPSFREREKACRDLEAIGAEAMPALLLALKSSDEEVASRAQLLVDRIDKTIQSQKYLAAPTLSLHFDDVPLERAVQEFGTKTNLYLDLTKVANRNRKVRLHLDNEPYWKAVEAFYVASGLMETVEAINTNSPIPAEQSPGRGRVTFVPNGRRGQRTLTGPRLLMSEGSSTLSSSLDRAIRVRAKEPARILFDDVKGEMVLSLELMAAPDMAIQRIAGVDIYRSLTNDNRDLRVAYPLAKPEFGVDDEVLFQKQVVLQGGTIVTQENMDQSRGNLPSEQVSFKTDGIRPQSFKELSGVVHVQMLTPLECRLNFKKLHLGDNDGQTDGRGLTCHKITLSELNDRFFTVQMELNYTPPEMGAITYTGQLRGQVRPLMQLKRIPADADARQPQIRFLDGDGSMLNTFFDRKGNASMDFESTTISISARVRKPANPDDLKIEIHTIRSVDLDMPFTLRDVSLNTIQSPAPAEKTFPLQKEPAR